MGFSFILDLLCVCGWWWRLYTSGDSCESPTSTAAVDHGWTVMARMRRQHLRIIQATTAVCMCEFAMPPVHRVCGFFFQSGANERFKTPPCMQARVKDSAAPTALSLWALRNKQSFKYFPTTGPPVSLQAVFFFFVKCICLRCFCDRVALSESRDVKKAPGRGKVAGHSKHVDSTWEEGTQLYKTTSWCGSQKESKCKELIMEVSVITLDTCVVVTCLGWA